MACTCHITQELDIRIQNQTNKKFSLDDIIKIIIANHTNNKQFKFTTQLLVNYINDLTHNSYDSIIHQFVNGKIDLSTNFLNSSKLNYKEIAINDYGFDIINPKKIVNNLDNKSAAYKAGLRNGTKFRTIRMSQENPQSVAKITVELHDGKIIKYHAQEKLVKIPQYVE